MSNEEIIRAWKDSGYRRSLGEADAAELPPLPVGAIDLGDTELDGVDGAEYAVTSWPCFLVATSAATSCTPSCDASVWDGTCNVASIGCCEPLPA